MVVQTSPYYPCLHQPSNIIRIKQRVLLLASAILASDWRMVSQPCPLIGWSCPLLRQTSYKHSTLISVFGQYLLSREFKHNPFKNIFVRHSCHYPLVLTWKHPFHLSKLCPCCLETRHNQIIKNKNLPDIISHTSSFIVHAIFFNYQKYFINTPKTMDFSTLQEQLKSKKYC